MPLLPKKPRDAKLVAQVAPAWHPNFRNAEKLPDTKTVRTAFFINIVAIVVTVVVLILAINRELELRALVNDIEGFKGQVAKEEAGSKKAVALAQKFAEEEKKLRELADFVGSGKFVLSDFILHLGEQLPPKLALTHIEYRPALVVLRGHAGGSADEAAGETDAYIRQLRSDPIYGPQFEDVFATIQGTNLSTGWYDFELNLKFKETAPPPKDDKDKDKDKEAKK